MLLHGLFGGLSLSGRSHRSPTRPAARQKKLQQQQQRRRKQEGALSSSSLSRAAAPRHTWPAETLAPGWRSPLQQQRRRRLLRRPIRRSRRSRRTRPPTPTPTFSSSSPLRFPRHLMLLRSCGVHGKHPPLPLPLPAPVQPPPALWTGGPAGCVRATLGACHAP